MPRLPEPKARLCWFLAGRLISNPRPAGPNRKAADALVKSLRALGRLEVVDEAHVMATVMLAESVDADPTNAALWGQYRAALDALRMVGAGGEGDAIDKLLAELGGADLPDTAQPQPADARGAGRARRGDVGEAADGLAAGGRRRRGGVAR